MIEIIVVIGQIVVLGLALYGFVQLVTERSRTAKDAAIIWTISRSPEGIYALDICGITGVSISTIYIVLARLQDSGAVRYMRDAQWPHRYRYFISKPG